MKLNMVKRAIDVQNVISFSLAIVIGIMIAGVVITSLSGSVDLTGTANTTFNNTINMVWVGLGLLGVLVIVVVAGILMQALG